MADDFVMARWRSDVLERDGLLNIDYPVPAAFVRQFRPGETIIGLDDLLYWLQCYAEQPSAEWQRFVPVMRRLGEVLATRIDGAPAAIEGERWYLDLGPVDLAAPLVAIQRAGQLLAAIASDEAGRLVVNAFQPLDARSIRLLLAAAVKPAPDGTVGLRPNNWEVLLDASASMGQAYASERGESYLSYWQFGLGAMSGGDAIPAWTTQRNAVPLPPAVVAAQLMVNAAHGAA